MGFDKNMSFVHHYSIIKKVYCPVLHIFTPPFLPPSSKSLANIVLFTITIVFPFQNVRWLKSDSL